jgi:hypothetical protein
MQNRPPLGQAWTEAERAAHSQARLIPPQAWKCVFKNGAEFSDDMAALMASPPPDNRLMSIRKDPLAISQMHAWEWKPPILHSAPDSLIHHPAFRGLFIARHHPVESLDSDEARLWLVLAFSRPDFSFSALIKLGKQLGVTDELMFARLAPVWGNVDYLGSLITWHEQRGSLSAIINSWGTDAFIAAFNHDHLDFANNLIHFPAVFASASNSTQYWDQCISPFVKKRLAELQERKIVFEIKNRKNIPFDVSDKEADLLFSILYHCIQRNKIDDPETLNQGIHRLLSIPSVKDLVIQNARHAKRLENGLMPRQVDNFYMHYMHYDSNVMLRCAKEFCNKRAAMQLLDIPDVRRIAKEQNFYEKDEESYAHRSLDLEWLAIRYQPEAVTSHSPLEIECLKEEENIPKIQALQEKKCMWQELIFLGRIYQDVTRLPLNYPNAYFVSEIADYINRNLDPLAISETKMLYTIKQAIAERRTASTPEIESKADDQLQILTGNIENRIKIFKEKIECIRKEVHITQRMSMMNFLIKKITDSEKQNDYQSIDWPSARKELSEIIERYRAHLNQSAKKCLAKNRGVVMEQLHDRYLLNQKRFLLERLSQLIKQRPAIKPSEQDFTNKEAVLRALIHLNVYCSGNRYLDEKWPFANLSRRDNSHKKCLMALMSFIVECLDALFEEIFKIPPGYRLTAVEGARFLDRVGHFKRKYHLEQKPGQHNSHHGLLRR